MVLRLDVLSFRCSIKNKLDINKYIDILYLPNILNYLYDKYYDIYYKYSESHRFFNLKCDAKSLDQLLIAASAHNDIPIVSFLLDRSDVDVNAQNIYDESALMYAASGGSLELVQLLLAKKDINVNMFCEEGGTALSRASCGDDIEIVKLLLKRSEIWINTYDDCGWSPLTYAVSHNHKELEDILREHGAHFK